MHGKRDSHDGEQYGEAVFGTIEGGNNHSQLVRVSYQKVATIGVKVESEWHKRRREAGQHWMTRSLSNGVVTEL
jgi:hypothetical protein